MIHQVIDVELCAIFVPVIINTACLTDYYVSYNSVYFCKRQSLVICDFAAATLKYKTRAEPFFFKILFVFAYLVNQLVQIIVIFIEYVLEGQK